MKRVLLITPELEYTGALNSFKRICKVLLNNGYLVDIWSYVEGPYIKEFDELGVYVEIIDEEIIDENFVFQRIFKYQLVIANTIVVYKAVELINNHVPLVWYIREGENLPDFFWKKGRKEALENAKKLYVVSEYAKDFIVKNYNKNVEVLHNYVDDVFDEFKDIKKDNSKLKFLTLGTIEKRKGYDVLLDAFIALPKEIREKCELHFAGRFWDGGKEIYHKVINQARKYPNIFYHKELRDRQKIHTLIANCDVVVVPSRDESCSLVALEGAMMAKPLILTQNIGAKYILNENNGYLIKTGDVIALKEAFIQAFNEKDSLYEKGKKARESYLQTSTYEIYEKNILKMIKDNICENSYLYKIKQNDYSLFSFDVFDTLISRKFAKPEAVFLVMKERLQKTNFPKILVKNFEEIRIKTEQYFYEYICNAKSQDVNFEEIYNLIALNFSLNEEQKQFLMNLEIQIESECLYPIDKNINLIKFLLKESKRVILISDMYFNSNTIRQFLIQFDDIFKDIPIYVSSEYKRKKNNGKLFKVVFAKEKISPKKWLHFGDNFNADILQARKLGIQTYFYFNNLLPYEEYALNLEPNHLALQEIISIAKKLRTQSAFSNLEEIGACFGAPMLLPYIFWVLKKAVINKVEVLYFIARDGFVLQKIADIIIDKENLNIQTKYLYGSRESFREPFENNNKEKIELIFKYLNQELNLDKKFAFVELCGTGKTLDYIVSFVEDMPNYKDKIFGSFYLFRSKLAKTKAPSFFMIPLNQLGSFYIELFARSLEGQVIGFKEENEYIKPICDDLEGDALKAFGYEDYINGVIKYTEYFTSFKDYQNLLTSMKLTKIYLVYINSNTIDKKIVEILGSTPFLLDGVSSERTIFAPRITNENTKNKTASFLWSVLRSENKIKMQYSLENNLNIIGAVSIIKSHLSYKLGNAILLNVKKPLGIIKLIFIIPVLIISHKVERKIYAKELDKKMDLGIYKDYNEAIWVKNFFSYRLGETILKTFRKHKILAIFVLPSSIIKLYKTKIKKDKNE